MTRPRSPFHRAAPAYSIRADASEPEILLYDEIGYFGVTAQDFVRDLAQIQAPTIHLRINSPGGSVFEGVAIANAIRQHPAQVVVHVDALAASIASIIALAGDEVRMADNAFFMIHDPWTLAIGSAAELRKQADTLDKIGESLVATYASASGQTADQVRAWMAAETWFTAAEADDAGFIDAIDAESDAKAEFDLSVFAHAPAALQSRQPNQKRDVERALRDAGFSRSEAKRVAALAVSVSTPREAEGTTDAEVLRLGERLLASITSK